MNNTVTLQTDMELLAAALSERKVLVVRRTNNVILLYPGIIEKYDRSKVRVSGNWYKRSDCLFQIA